jgi:predicted nucleic acid-binding Zn ribbon protein
MGTKRKCLFCGNPTYSLRQFCSKECKRKMHKLRNKQPKYYFNDKSRKWEQLN